MIRNLECFRCLYDVTIKVTFWVSVFDINENSFEKHSGSEG